MAESAAVRALRTMDLIPYVLENPSCSIKTLAKRFSTSEKQIEKDLELIFMCGLPGYTPYELIDIVLEDGVVSVIDPQVLNRPRRFSKTELVVIVLGLKILSEIKLERNDLREKIDKLIAKVSHIKNEEILFNDSQMISSKFVEVINRAIGNRQVLRIGYISVTKDQSSERDVVPLTLYYSNGSLYMNAFDVEKKAERVFRVDAITRCEAGAFLEFEVNQSHLTEITIELEVQDWLRFFVERNMSII
ncbi:MAG: WYL domain-containing protein, partial [Actinobacteria bacterium]|nr:WYL domain-containing protein [Actinomycetota bacterium]